MDLEFEERGHRERCCTGSPGSRVRGYSGCPGVPMTATQRGATLPARAGGEAAVGLSLIPQAHGGALLSGGRPGNPGHNQHTARQRAQEVRGHLIGQLEGAAKDLAAILETARDPHVKKLRHRDTG